MNSKNYFLNFISKLMLSLLPGILTLVLNQVIISSFGSDTNGLINTFSQIVNYFSIFESGLTVAATVSLYKPYLKREYFIINETLTFTKRFYSKISNIIVILSLFFAFLSPLLFQTKNDYLFTAFIFFVMSLNLTFQFYFTLNFNIIFSFTQKEYINNLVLTFFNLLTQATSIFVLYFGFGIIEMKFIPLIFVLLRIPVYNFFVRKYYPQYKINKTNLEISSLKENQKDVFFQKISILLFNSTPIILISIVFNTISASVFSIYNFIFNYIKLFIFSVVQTPFNIFGKMYQEKNRNDFNENFKLFIFMSVFLSFIFLNVTFLLVIPFLRLYTINFIDANYIDHYLPILMVLSSFFEIISNIYSLLCNSSGHFKEIKMFSFYSSLINILLSLLFVYFFGFYGIIIGTLISYFIFDITLILFVEKKFSLNYSKKIIYLIFVNSIIFGVLSMGTYIIPFQFNNYFEFIIFGSMTFISVTIIYSFLNFIFFPNQIVPLIRKIRLVLSR